jgi:HEAT repeat protein
MMNKFAYSNCIECKRSSMQSNDFSLVSGKIVEMLDGIRMRSPLQEADDWIRDQHYTTDRLKIERLSGEVLSMDQCYINLAAVEEHRDNAQHAEKEVDAAPNSSRSSLAARQNVETPNKNIQVELPSLFDLRENSNGQKVQPRRVLIRGRAGIGKTTLCKKMVREFQTPEFRNWNKLFDRVLWVPLRRLKEWPKPPDNLEKLFIRMYFNQKTKEKSTCLAQALCDVAERGSTLFILDGLDEIAGYWDNGHGMSEFLRDLLNQPNVIITCRPHVSLPANVQAPDVELETIGFFPDQVNDYIQAAFTDTERDFTDKRKIEDVQSYLKAHQPIQDLVRIPIQLDALCFTWDKDFSAENVPESMTEVFEAISLKLWRKDIHRLYAKPEPECRTMNITRVKKLMGEHMNILEALAFSGLYNNILEFDSNHRDQIYNHFNLSVSEFLVECLSFLRTSDPSAGKNNQHYHFLHLTFQEYFAARYFVRQWQSKQPLCCMQFNKREFTEIKTATFLQENKYKPRYDILWRFVAGLLSVDRDALDFFKAVEEKPRDLLGPTHQYLVMHCLSEVERKDTAFAELRTELEKTLKKWLLFECHFTRECYLASKMECPEQVLANALNQASEDTRKVLLGSLNRRAAIPSRILDLVVSWLENGVSAALKIAILCILEHKYKNLPSKMLRRIESLLDDEDWCVREAAARALQGQANITDNLLQRITAPLEDVGQVARRIEHELLPFQGSITNLLLQRIAERLEDGDNGIREAVLGVMQGEANLTDSLLQRIAGLLENNDDKNLRVAVLQMLEYQDNVTSDLLQCVKNALKDEDLSVQCAAVRVFQHRANLKEDLLQRIAGLLESNDDEDLQVEVLKALQGQGNFSDELLQRIAELLRNNKNEDVQEEAFEVLQGQDNLTVDLLQCVRDALKAEDLSVRWAAIRVFRGRANLTEDLLEPIPGLLINEEYGIREIALEVLLSQTALSLDSLGKDRSSFFQVLVVKSFKEHLYCLDESFIRTGSRRVPLICKRENQVRDEILKLQKDLGVSFSNTENTSFSQRLEYDA